MAAPVIALVGDDSYLQIANLTRIVVSLGDAQRFDVDGETASLADVLDLLREFSMFGTGKLVVVRNADKFISNYREKLEDYVTSPASGATLVLRVSTLPSNTRIAKLIDKHGQVIKCEPPKDRELPAWIVQQAKTAHGLQFTSDAAAVLADYVGPDLGKLDNELAKLALQVESGKVTPEDVTKSVAFQREQEMWQFTMELTAGRFDEALVRWRRLLQTEPSAEFRATVWLTMWLEKASRVLALRRQKMAPMAIAKELKIWPAAAIDGWIAVAERLGPAGIDRATDFLADLDRRAKTGVGDMAGNVERFIASLANNAVPT